MIRIFVFFALLLATGSAFCQTGASVSFEQWLSLHQVSAPQISPDGRLVVYTVTRADWGNNVFDAELWLAREGGEPVQLTRTSKGSSIQARFTHDGRFVSFIADRGEKNQVYLISVNGGEALQVTYDEDGISSYEWSPDGKLLAYSKPDPLNKIDKNRKERFGNFTIEGEHRSNHLWLLDFDYQKLVNIGNLPCLSSKDSIVSKLSDCTPAKSRRLTEGDFHVTSIAWNPDGKSIAFTRQPNGSILTDSVADIATVDIATKKVHTLIANSKGDFFRRWSPDGKSFIYASTVDNSTSEYYVNNRLFIYDFKDRKSREVGAEIDEIKNVQDWTPAGIYLTAYEKMKQYIYHLDPKTGKAKRLALNLDFIDGISFSKHTDRVALQGRTYETLSEVYTGALNAPFKALSRINDQIAEWNTPVNDVMQWKSKDGTLIEGVLSKPRQFDPKKKYPLLVVLHGGPTGIDVPAPTAGYFYPIMQWVEKGALVLRVNYRGSSGYGEKFRSLNVRNLGVGDMWDAMSGIDYLNDKGFIDTTRMGCMGWSQGGYISAFLTTNTHAFKAISVGAGISNWTTYYVNTDNTPFTRQYLQATPWQDNEIYLRTSPMTSINQATTPTLIQHGEFDKRVPIPNAYELYRGLQDRGVPSELIVYKGFGHTVNKPKERLAVIRHNWAWFNHYIFGEKLELFSED